MRSRIAICCLSVLAVGAAASHAAPQLPAVFSHHMVVQRDTFVPVWGKAEAGEKITVTLGDQRNEATADAKGHWLCTLPPSKAGGPLTLSVVGKTTLQIRDVLVGEVWLCAGASNMAFDVQRASDAEKEIAAAKLPQLRLYDASEPKSGWQPCTPDAVAGFSAAAYFFGRTLHQRLGVPVGLIQSTEPRSPIEAWMSRDALATLPELKRLLERMDRYNDEAVARQKKMIEWWQAAIPAALAKDAGSQGDRWAKPALEGDDTARWRKVTLPRDPAQRLTDAWRLPRGVVWLRREVELPAALAGKALVLGCRFVDEQKDAAYLNGVKLAKAPGGFGVPAAAAKAGRAVVAVRMVNLLGRGLSLLHAGRDQMRLSLADGKGDAVALAGTWLYRTGVRARAASLPALPPPLPPRPSDKASPAALHPRRIAPIEPFGIRGVTWYQGEANVSHAAQYATLFPALIADWRKAWRRPKMPFLFVQLSGCSRKRKEPGDDAWAELREAQAAALRVPHTAMAVTLDIGRRATPPNKQEVGRRLALLARANAYGEKIPAHSPLYESSAVEEGRIRVRFRGAEGGLAARGGDTARLFAIAGADRKFVWADFKIDGETVVVWNREVAEPVAVRYAWEHTPRFEHRKGEGWVTLGLLFSQAGLPVAPFRSDHWASAGR